MIVRPWIRRARDRRRAAPRRPRAARWRRGIRPSRPRRAARRRAGAAGRAAVRGGPVIPRPAARADVLVRSAAALPRCVSSLALIEPQRGRSAGSQAITERPCAIIGGSAPQLHELARGAAAARAPAIRPGVANTPRARAPDARCRSGVPRSVPRSWPGAGERRFGRLGQDEDRLSRQVVEQRRRAIVEQRQVVLDTGRREPFADVAIHRHARQIAFEPRAETAPEFADRIGREAELARRQQIDASRAGRSCVASPDRSCECCRSGDRRGRCAAAPRDPSGRCRTASRGSRTRPVCRLAGRWRSPRPSAAREGPRDRDPGRSRSASACASMKLRGGSALHRGRQIGDARCHARSVGRRASVRRRCEMMSGCGAEPVVGQRLVIGKREDRQLPAGTKNASSSSRRSMSPRRCASTTSGLRTPPAAARRARPRRPGPAQRTRGLCADSE